jgi:hypothetical protein
MNANDIAALRLIGSGGGKGLTNHANVIVSAAAAGLLQRGLIDYDASRWVGYKLTNAGRCAIA